MQLLPEREGSAILSETRFPHTHHAKIARRANLSQVNALAMSGKSERCSRPSRLDEEGRMRYRHDTWGGDAMDADGTSDERGLSRTVKSRGPGLPTLRSSWRWCFASRQRRGQESPVPEEIAI